jgi:hypothetical protein
MLLSRVIDKFIPRIILNVAPLGWSCWYSTSVTNGVLRERGFQALCAKVCICVFYYGFTVEVYQHWQPKICDQFIETDIQ